ncbi:MAG: hypothetical protein R3A48_25395 [Polyangiales bacterium]
MLRRPHITLCAALLGCASTRRPEPQLPRAVAAPRFSLRFLRGACPFVYAYEPWLACARGLDPARPLVALDERDVRGYEVRGAPRFEVAITLTDDAAARVRAARATLSEVPVLVSLDGQLLYAAREYLQQGAAAIRFPVIHLDRLNEGVLRVRPALMPSDDLRVIDRPELRAFFRALAVAR